MTAIIFGATPPLPKRCLTCKRPQWHWNEHSREWDCLTCKHANPCVTLYGPGPADTQCKACSHMYQKHYDKVYWKCDMRKDTNGPGTDHRRKWPACALFEPIQEEKS